MLLGMTIAVSAAICQVWTRLRAIEYGYRLSEATRRQAKLIETNRKLRLEVALLTSPQRIGREVADLELQPPRPEQIRRLRYGAGPKPSPSGSKPAIARLGP
jgi:hypothetical protein